MGIDIIMALCYNMLNGGVYYGNYPNTDKYR